MLLRAVERRLLDITDKGCIPTEVLQMMDGLIYRQIEVLLAIDTPDLSQQLLTSKIMMGMVTLIALTFA
jgi:hypothetical protein